MTEDYERKKRESEKYQDFVQIELYKVGIPICIIQSKKYQIEYGESIGGWEIKQDCVMARTGNVWIETHEKSNATNKNYVESGILRKDNTWMYCIGDYTRLYIIPKNSLVRLYEREHKKLPAYRMREYEEKQTPTSIGFTLKADWVGKYMAAKVLYFGARDNAPIQTELDF